MSEPTPLDAEAPVVAAISPEALEKAFQLLRDLLHRGDGCVGVVKLRRELEVSGFVETSDIIEKIRLGGQAVAPPVFHAGRSFYTKDTYERRQRKVEEVAESAAAEAPALPDKEEETEAAPKRRESRQEEARIVTYVVDELADIYYSAEHTPDADCAFDVHNERGGGDFENIDAVAVDWRAHDSAEIVAVEAKLGFTAKLVQQANNYRRFADRVWIALPITESLDTAARELRKTDPYLFDYVIECGLGILACRRTRGNRYEVAAVHWPRLGTPSKLERRRFLERHRDVFERAQVLQPEAKRRATVF